MAGKTVTVNSVVVEVDGQPKQFVRGEVIEDPKVLEQLGDHVFATEGGEQQKEVPDLETLSVRELREVCENLGIEPTSNHKKDLVDQIKAHTEA